eukprot:Lankesteria_metandrocarpae@DN9318_c0_g1_i1.p1
MPRLEECLQQLVDKEYFTQLDFTLAYFSMPMSKNTKRNLCFQVNRRNYCFNRLPMGAGCSLSIFARIVDDSFGDLYELSIVAYFDNIIIATNGGRGHHLEVTQMVLQRMKDLRLVVRFAKGMYATRALELLGWQVDGVVRQPCVAIRNVIEGLGVPPHTRKSAISAL